jgi:hypothetical protein
MGLILKQAYDYVTMKAGFKGRLRLTVMTGIPSSRAAEIPDEKEIVARFKVATAEILGENVSPFQNKGQ